MDKENNNCKKPGLLKTVAYIALGTAMAVVGIKTGKRLGDKTIDFVDNTAAPAIGRGIKWVGEKISALWSKKETSEPVVEDEAVKAE